MEGNEAIQPENVAIPEKKLTAREEKFCWCYVACMVAGKAAREAGFSEASCYEIGSRLLRKVHILERISQIRKESAGKYDIGKETLIQELAMIAKFDLREVYDENGKLKPPSEWSEEAGHALAGVEVDEIKDTFGNILGYTKKVKRDNKISAIDLLNKMFGNYEPEKKELTGPGGGAMQFIFNPAAKNEPLPED